MKKIKLYKFLKLFVFLVFYYSFVSNSYASEPIVVLEYSSNNIQDEGVNSSSTFISNPNFSTKHRVSQDET